MKSLCIQTGSGVPRGLHLCCPSGKLTTILGQIIAQRARIESQLQAVATYCRYRNLPLPLKRSVQEYFSVRCAQRAICDEEQILKDMSPSLKAQV